MTTDPPASDPEVAFNVTVPGVVVDLTMAINLPLKAACEVPLYESWLVGSPPFAYVEESVARGCDRPHAGEGCSRAVRRLKPEACSPKPAACSLPNQRAVVVTARSLQPEAFRIRVPSW